MLTLAAESGVYLLHCDGDYRDGRDARDGKYTVVPLFGRYMRYLVRRSLRAHRICP